MIKKFLTIITCACLHSVFAQTLPDSLPVVQSPLTITPAHTVYVSLSGNDSNTGSFNSPVKTIEAAFLKIPVPASGQQLYAEIVLLPGTYYRIAPVRQQICHYRANGGYRNVSLRGIAPVVIDFTQVPYASAADRSCITLLGDHISVKNLTIRAGNSTLVPPFANTLNFTSSGDNCNGVGYTKARSAHILIDRIKVDSVYQHGLQVSDVDTLLIQNCSVKHSCLKNQGRNIEGWPSAIKVRLCTHATVRNNSAFENYGEGIISNRTRYSAVYSNTCYDNYSHNIYVDNGEKVMVFNNLCYNTNPAYWTRAKIAANGVSVATEHYPQNDWGVLNEIYVFNNVLINSGKGLFWNRSRVDSLPPVTHSNIWLVHNSVIGVMGDLAQTTERLRCLDIAMEHMKTGRINLTNGNVYNNFFSIDPAMIGSNKPGEPAKGIVTATYGGQPTQLYTGNNVWKVSPLLSGSRTYPYNVITDELDTQLPIAVALPSLDVLRPNQQYLSHVPFPLPFIQDDYDGMYRLGCHDNCGAFINGECPSENVLFFVAEPTLQVFPNPAAVGSMVHLDFEQATASYGLLLFVYNWQGEEVSGSLIGTKDGWDFTPSEKGWYFIKVTNPANGKVLSEAVLIVN